MLVIWTVSTVVIIKLRGPQERAGILGYPDGCIVGISESLPIGECHLGGAAAWVA